MVRIWTPNQRRFQAWLSLPKYERVPPTQGLLSKQMGVTDRTLHRWKQLPGWWDAVNASARQYLHEDLASVFGALRREADKGSFQHIKLILEMTGEYVEQQSTDLTVRFERDANDYDTYTVAASGTDGGSHNTAQVLRAVNGTALGKNGARHEASD